MRRRWISVLLVVTVLTILGGVVPVLAAPTADEVVHVVGQGETLSSIARRYGVSAWAIARHNGIVNPSRIYVGQRLVIPASDACGREHLVQAGESLYGVASLYGMHAWPVARANGIFSLEHMPVGQPLIIPCPAAAPPEPPLPAAMWPGPWTGEYFDNSELSGSPYVTRSDASINFDWGYGAPASGMPADDFSVRWTGTFEFAEGTYRFYARVDDGVRVYVDDELIIDGWRAGAVRTYTADRALTSGDHSIKVEYYEWIQVARMVFWVNEFPEPGPPPAAHPMRPPADFPVPPPADFPVPTLGVPPQPP